MSAFDPANATIHDWLIRYIKRQRFMESLDFIAGQLKADTDDGYEYTKAPEMNAVRKAWWEQKQFAEAEQ